MKYTVSFFAFEKRDVPKKFLTKQCGLYANLNYLEQMIYEWLRM